MTFTWVHALCLIAAGASAQSFDSGFGLNGLNNFRGRCVNEFAVRTPIIETSRIRVANFVGPAVAHQTCDCIKAVVRPQTKKEIVAVPNVQRFFQTPSNAIIQTVPFGGARDIHVPAFSLPPLKMFAEVIPATAVDSGRGILSGTAVNIGPSIARPLCCLDGNFQGIVNGAFLGDSFGAARKLVDSFPGNVGAGFSARVSGAVIPRSSVVGGNFPSGLLRNRC